MEEYLLYLINNFSLEIFLMSLAIFGATMLIKIPTKRATSKLDEAKRQGINTLIMLIPLTLAFLACLVYFYIKDKPILSFDYVSCSLSTCIMSISIYLIYARVVIIIKGIVSGKTKISIDDVQKISTDISNVLQNKKEFSSEKQNTKANLNDIKNKINTLIAFRQQLEKNNEIQTITILSETNEEIKRLEEQAKQLAK